MSQRKNKKVYYHLPGLFEFYELYCAFLPLYKEHREYFYDWCEISSIYGSPADCLWGGGRAGFGSDNPEEVLKLTQEYGISARLTFSNSLLRKEHLTDKKCNILCKMFEEGELETDAKIGASRAIRVPGYKYVKVDQKMQEDNQEASKDLQTDVTDQRVRLEDVMGVITTELEKLITTQ